MTVAWRMMTSQTWPLEAAAAGTSCKGRSRSNSLRTSSGEGKWQWGMSNYEFEDVCDLATAATAVDGNEDVSKNDSNNDDDRRTSLARSNFIVRILFLTLLLLAYSKILIKYDTTVLLLLTISVTFVTRVQFPQPHWDQYAWWHFFGIHYQNCTKLQGTNSRKLPVLVMCSKEEVQY